MDPILQIAGIFAIPVGLSLWVATTLYVEAVRLHYAELARQKLYFAAIDAALAKAPQRHRTRPVAPFIVTPASNFWVDRAGNAFARAVI